MKSYSALIIIPLFIFGCLISVSVAAQCNQKLSSSNIKFNTERSSVSFKLNISTETGFDGQLLKIQGTSEKLIESFSGGSSQIINFDNLALENEAFYRVVVSFISEESFLCKRRVLDIEFTNRD